MKILIISHEYPPLGGGGGNACMNLSREYAKRGHTVAIITVWYPGLPGDMTENGVRILRLPAKRRYLEHCGFGEMLDYLWKAWKEADRLHRQEQFDICHVFFAIPGGPVGYYLKKRYRLPYVIRFGGGDIPGFQERFQLIYKLIAPFEKILWKNASALVANSRGLKKRAQSFYDKKEILTIPNGVDLDAFPCKKGGSCENGYCILFVSRLIERKGLQFIIPQLGKLQKSLDKPLKLLVVGDGPYRETLEALTMQYGADGLVEFAGQKEKRELPDYYGKADIFILPSSKEGMANVVLEAMASGLPVIMTPCEGSEELIQGNGYAVPTEQFADRISELLLDDNARSRCAYQSRKLAEEKFQWRLAAESFEGIFEKAVKGKQ